jgi:hypothetical protein
VDRKGLRVVGWPDRCGDAPPAPPVVAPFGRVGGHPVDLVMWRGARPPDGDAVWHPFGCWVALRFSASVAG